MKPLLLSRRDLLKAAGLSAVTLGVGGCSQSAQTQSFGGARLSAIMRQTFIPGLAEIAERQSADWAAQRNATIALRHAEDWREQADQAARLRQGDDLAELFGNAAVRYSDRLVDLSDLAQQLADEQGPWMPAAEATARLGGGWRAIPWAFTAQALNYRADILDMAGVQPPTTYDELLGVADALRVQRLPTVGLSMSPAAPNDSASLAYSMLWAFGGSEVDATGQRVAIDSGATVAALEYWAELSAVSNPQAPAFDEVGNNDAFARGQIALTQNASSIYWNLLRDDPMRAASMNHVRLPSGPAGFHQLVEMNSIGLFSHSRNQTAAKGWIRAMTTPEQFRERAQLSLTFFSPPLLSYVEDPQLPWNTDPKLAAMKEIHSGGHVPGWPGPASVEAAIVHQNQSVVQMFRSVSAGQQTARESARTAAEALKRVYET